MPRPNPPRKRPRRRPDAVERNTRAEVSLTKQTAEVKERKGNADAKQPNAKALPSTKTRTNTKAGPPPRVRAADQPFEPWAKRSYAIFVAAIAVSELVVGSGLFLTLSNIKINFGLFLLALDEFNPLIAVLGAILAAPIAKFIAKETRTLRFVESAMAGVTQYFIWLVLSFAITFLIGGFVVNTAPATGTGSSSTSSTPLPTVAATPTPTSGSSATAPSPTAKASTTTVTGITTVTATPGFVAGLVLVDLISFVATYYLYPPLYRRLRRRPMPPRQPRAPRGPKPAKAAAQDVPTSNAKQKGRRTSADKMDESAAQAAEAKASDHPSDSEAPAAAEPAAQEPDAEDTTP